MSAPIPRPGILDIKTYVPGKATLSGVEEVVKLSSNEGALGPSSRALEAYEAAAKGVSEYPDGSATELRETIGAHHGLDPSRIVCGCGSDELIGLLFRAYAGVGDEILYSEHGFLMYPLTALGIGATPVTAPETNLRASVEALLDRVTPNTRILALANPNNPTGTYISRAELERLRTGLREDVLLIIDAAYAEYVTVPDYSPGVELVDAAENVVMIRTFSKLYALASMRVGWVYCPHTIADVLNRIRPVFNVGGPSQAAAIAALEDRVFAEESRAHNDTWCHWLAKELAQLGLKVCPSVANFVLVQFPNDTSHNAEAADAFLNARGLIPRRLVDYGLPDSLRITVGRAEHMRAVRDALAEFMADADTRPASQGAG